MLQILVMLLGRGTIIAITALGCTRNAAFGIKNSNPGSERESARTGLYAGGGGLQYADYVDECEVSNTWWGRNQAKQESLILPDHDETKHVQKFPRETRNKNDVFGYLSVCLSPFRSKFPILQALHSKVTLQKRR